MDGFIEARNSLIQLLNQPGHHDKENVPFKKHNYNSNASNLRESLQSMKNM